MKHLVLSALLLLSGCVTNYNYVEQNIFYKGDEATYTIDNHQVSTVERKPEVKVVVKETPAPSPCALFVLPGVTPVPTMSSLDDPSIINNMAIDALMASYIKALELHIRESRKELETKHREYVSKCAR